VAEERIARVFRGRRAFALYLQCFQLILWKQSRALVDDKGFPKELEVVVRDLWGLRLQSFSERLGTEDDASDSNTTGSSQRLSSQGSGHSSSEFSTASSSEVSSAEEGRSHGRTARQARQLRLRKGKKALRLVDSLSTIYLACLLLRLPVSIGDIGRWAQDDSLIYFRAIRSVPKDMTTHLPAQYFHSLDTMVVLKPKELQMRVHELAAIYDRDFGLSFPSINVELMLFKYVKALAMPLETYMATKRLALIVGYTFTYRADSSRSRITDLPEVQLMCLLIMSVKLSQPFENFEAYPRLSYEAAALRIDWDKWLAIFKKPDSLALNGGLQRGDEKNVTEQDVFELSSKDLDTYLDWYERTWVEEREVSKMPEQLLRLFPTGRTQDTDSEASGQGIDDERNVGNIMTVVSDMILQRVVTATSDDAPGKAPRPGSFYKIYRKDEEMPPAAKAFYERAGETIGVGLEEIRHGMLQTENKVKEWVDEKRKKKAAQKAAV
jgi:RNA polymerase I-specific transcription initiation factor RRN7